MPLDISVHSLGVPWWLRQYHCSWQFQRSPVYSIHPVVLIWGFLLWFQLYQHPLSCLLSQHVSLEPTKAFQLLNSPSNRMLLLKIMRSYPWRWIFEIRIMQILYSDSKYSRRISITLPKICFSNLCYPIKTCFLNYILSLFTFLFP